jgi:hypothetical protein
MWWEKTQVRAELGEILDRMVCYHFSGCYQSAAVVLEDLIVMSDGVQRRSVTKFIFPLPITHY